jgi:hypothetical protein
MKLVRCKCFVIDPVTHRQRKCLKKNCKACPTLCHVHARKYAIQIQRAYRGYITRRKIALFQNLPSELWNKVLYFTRYQHNIQTKYRRSVMDVHNNRILKAIDLASAAVTAQVYTPQLTISLYTLRIEKEYIAHFFDNNELVLT